MKVGIKVKEKEMISLLIALLSQNKNIKKCSYQKKEILPFPKIIDTVLTIEYVNKDKTNIVIEFKNTSFPKTIEESCKQLKSMNLNLYCIILAPSFSKKSASICINNNIGYLDSAGNCFINFDNVFINISGEKNVNLPKQRGLTSIYERSSVVSSKILRLMFSDIHRKWKLSEISEKVGCSIGQVAKVKKFLLDNIQITQTKDGIELRNPEEILKEWASVYHKKENEVIECYSLDDVSEIEAKLAMMKKEIGIDYYLTGFSGGSRYQPIIRYHKVHCYIMSENIEKVMKYLDCKRVKGGSNIDFIIPYNNCIFDFSEEKNGSSIVSPIQLYLDCMGLKNRGEELAEAILEKDILYNDTRRRFKKYP